jgi:hypothetical protein
MFSSLLSRFSHYHTPSYILCVLNNLPCISYRTIRFMGHDNFYWFLSFLPLLYGYYYLPFISPIFHEPLDFLSSDAIPHLQPILLWVHLGLNSYIVSRYLKKLLCSYVPPLLLVVSSMSTTFSCISSKYITNIPELAFLYFVVEVCHNVAYCVVRHFPIL